MCLIHKSGLIAWIGERNNQLFRHLRYQIDRSALNVRPSSLGGEMSICAESYALFT